MRALPTVRTEEMVFLTKQEVDTIAEEIGELYRPLVILLAHTGLRWSEATALKVGDVELFGKRKTLTVVRAWKRDDDGTMYIGEPKSRRSRRTLPLDAATVDALIPLVAARNPGEWLFLSKTGRVVAHSTFRKDHWVPALDAAQRVGDAREAAQDPRHAPHPRVVAHRRRPAVDGGTAAPGARVDPNHQRPVRAPRLRHGRPRNRRVLARTLVICLV
jgi:integrase